MDRVDLKHCGSIGHRRGDDGWRRGLFVLALILCSALPQPAHALLESYAIVNGDGSLLVRGKRVHLHGIFIPQHGRLCDRTLRPAFCGSRAAVALDFKIQGFVRCEVVAENDDGSLDAFCAVRSGRFRSGEDLGAYLIRAGLALATPEAPFAYHALERIAHANGVGVWGFQVDSIQRR